MRCDMCGRAIRAPEPQATDTFNVPIPDEVGDAWFATELRTLVLCEQCASRRQETVSFLLAMIGVLALGLFVAGLLLNWP